MLDPASDPGVKTYRCGTHRAAAPAETVARLRPHWQRFGITRVANLTGLDRTGVPVVMVCRPNARSSAVFHGKGADLDAAKASGLMEAVETWHAEHVDRALRRASAAELGRRNSLIDLAGLPMLPGGRFDPQRKLLWIEGTDLMAGAPAFLPFDIVHSDSTIGASDVTLEGAGFAVSTNGLASGNHRLEAVSHGICEVIERDATSLWNRSGRERQQATRLDLATIDDPACRAVVGRLEQAALDVAVWDVTTDIGVPAFLAVAAERDADDRHVGRGAGCHPARAIALLRALTEAAQVRTTYILGSREDILHDDYRPDALAARNAAMRALMRPDARPRAFAEVANAEFDTFAAELEWILGRLRTAGIGQAVAVDLTRPELLEHGLGIAVMRVVVPGLEGSDHHAGYAPGKRARQLSGASR